MDKQTLLGNWLRNEHNADRSNITGLHVEYSQPFGENGWRVGALVTANRQTHPKIPNYQMMNIPRDPGQSDGFKVGVGLVRSRGGSTLGFDVVLEPIRTRTWAEAVADTQRANGTAITRGQHTVDNRFRFSNAVLRAGFGHDVPVVADSSANLGFQLGLGIRSIRYTLQQDNHLLDTTRSQVENWIEWTPTLGVKSLLRERGDGAGLGWMGVIQVVLFMAILLAGFVYVWRKGILDWGKRTPHR